ncbi:MAG: selenocysteine-specific translation elongation factor [Anaerolineales bacterium]|nr:selenocysteine-specific translation elongation factor [Anaerolineales bacterium]
MHVVATAGHVDHGKSALVKALSGIDPDRLKEEQARQMTIDLGFAWARLPDGDPIGIIDVPGHEDFIENMLAGLGSIDAVLFVVAADEGPRPQTVEHAEILGLLHVACGVVALTKADLVREPEWLQLVQQDVAALLRSAGLPAMAQVPVSSATGEGLTSLRAELSGALAGAVPRVDLGRPRLSVDRVFSMEGFGTVVTGTLTDGRLSPGQEIEIAPGGQRARIRGLQTHGERLTVADPGRRLAVNLAGVQASDVQRGDVLMAPGVYPASSRIDVRVEVLPSAQGGLKHGEAVKVFHGTARRMGRLRLLEADRLGPGEGGWAQLELEVPLVASPRDRFVLRRPSPSCTVAGGRIADLQPGRRHRRGDAGLLASLDRLLSSEAADRLLESAVRLGPAPPQEIRRVAGVSDEIASGTIAGLERDGQLIQLPGPGSEPMLMAESSYLRARQAMQDVLADYRRNYPLRFGMPKEELRSKAGVEAKLFAATLDVAERQGILERDGVRIRLAGAIPTLTSSQRDLLDRFLREVATYRFSPMSVKDARAMLGDDLFQFELESRNLVQVSAEVFFDGNTYAEMLDRLVQATQPEAGITVAEVRDLFGTTRKYALALMEHLDATGLTVREGDRRRFKIPAPGSAL